MLIGLRETLACFLTIVGMTEVPLRSRD